MVGCSNSACQRGYFFHLDCVGLRQQPDENEDWLCSKESRNSNMSTLCLCATYRDSRVVCCSSAECIGAGLYHMECVWLDAVPGTQISKCHWINTNIHWMSLWLFIAAVSLLSFNSPCRNQKLKIYISWTYHWSSYNLIPSWVNTLKSPVTWLYILTMVQVLHCNQAVLIVALIYFHHLRAQWWPIACYSILPPESTQLMT